MDDLKHFNPGDLIFKQGDLSTSMLVIKEGSVEIFKDTPNGEVFLTLQNPGEVVGLLSFFHQGKRLASARARTHVEGQSVERKDGQDPLQKLPKWVQVVLKEFSLRLEQINNQYAEALRESEQLKTKVIDAPFVSMQIAESFAELGKYKAKKFEDGREMIFIEDMVQIFETCLCYDRSMIDRVILAFKNTGMLKIEIEPDRGKEVTSLTGAMRLKWYAEFLRSTRSGKNRKLVQQPLSFKHRKMIFALKDFVQKSGGDIGKTQQYALEALIEGLSKTCKVNLEEAAIEAAEKLGLLEVKRAAEKVTVSFQPTQLVRTLIAVNTIRRLKAEPGQEGEEEREAS